MSSINIINDLNTKKKKKSKKTIKFQNDFFIEYLNTSIEQLDFEDIIQKDKRSFFDYLCDSIIDRQIIVNTFYAREPLRPLTIKIILLDINLILYFVINGLFYSEDYISKIYHNEDEKFLSFIPRSINRFVYTTIVSIFINFLIEFFFIEEKKIKGIFHREKENIFKLKFEISCLTKKIRNRFFSFIITIFVLSLFFWYYFLCFNYVYPYTQYDWIKSSITIILFMQILSALTSLLETILRYLSFFFKSERIFKVSKLLE